MSRTYCYAEHLHRPDGECLDAPGKVGRFHIPVDGKRSHSRNIKSFLPQNPAAGSNAPSGGVRVSYAHSGMRLSMPLACSSAS